MNAQTTTAFEPKWAQTTGGKHQCRQCENLVAASEKHPVWQYLTEPWLSVMAVCSSCAEAL